MRHGHRWTWSVVLIAIVGGCNLAGPTAIRDGRDDYNVAIQQTNNEQFLLNIVRLRYRDSPLMLEVTSLSTNFQMEIFGSANASMRESSPNWYGVLAGAEYTEKPTITYLPLQGEKFVSQMLTPLDPQVILLLYHSGWSIDRILRICLQSANDLPNAPSASGPTPDDAPRYEGFYEMCRLLRILQKRGHLVLGRVMIGDKPEIQIVIAEEAMDSPEVSALGALLGQRSSSGRYKLSTTRRDDNAGLIAIVTRPLSASLFYISQGVEPPDQDVDAGRVTTTRTPDGSEFHWSEMLGNLFTVYSSQGTPKDAYVAVRYRGTWFYIDDSDLTTKSTFFMIRQLLALQSGEVKGTGPILTLPVTN
ncbi:MAG: hypothetical protein GY715_14765 [Planctomycetes bacterium]|nr:hypothetical protein [Planctomycetota bacterium]